MSHPRTPALLAALLIGCGDASSAQDSSGGATTPDTGEPTTSDATTVATDTTTATDTTDTTDTTGADASTTTSDDTTGAPLDILEQLAMIDGLEVEERASPVEGYRYFVLGFHQPADHGAPDGLRFTQRMTLLHRDSAAPLVLSTSGYFIYPDSPGLGEVATLLAGNQLSVEHRFFEPSRPDPADWATLTIEQAAADLHRITGAFKPLYPARWLATGASKGGMTSVYFRRFYPDDVDATIAYVAPQSYGEQDPRYLDFIAGLGDAGCRAALATTQRELLLRRPAMVSRMQALAPDGYTFEHLGEDRALETAALELPFTFWQYGGADDCAAVPAQDASDDELWAFVDAYNSPTYWSDYQFEQYEPYFYQAAVQLGYPAYDESVVADLLLYPGVDVAATYVLPDKTPQLDTDAMLDIAAWLDTDGRALLFVYGEHDPYTAAAFEPGGAEDAYRFIAPGENHGARIVDLAPADRDQALAALGEWSGVAPQLPLVVPPGPTGGYLRDRPR